MIIGLMLCDNYCARFGPFQTFRPSNLYIAARKRVHRVIDVALFISNMTGLATIAVRRFEYEGYQV